MWGEGQTEVMYLVQNNMSSVFGVYTTFFSLKPHMYRCHFLRVDSLTCYIYEHFFFCITMFDMSSFPAK